MLEGETHLAIRSDRRDHLPYGLSSGKPGTGSINVLYRKDGSREVLPVMISTTMRAGEVLYHRQPGGGGWGDPLERSPESVLRDVKNQKISLRSAREDYAVILDPEDLRTGDRVPGRRSQRRME